MADNSYLGTDEAPVIPPTSDEKTMALLAHVLTFVFPILAPLVIYLVKKDESSFVAYHAKESLNFQISLFIICFALFITIIGILVVWIVAILGYVFVIVATIRASEGRLYRYPFSIRLIKWRRLSFFAVKHKHQPTMFFLHLPAWRKIKSLLCSILPWSLSGS